MFDPLDMRGQEQAREEKARAATVDLENEYTDLRWLMGSRRGRRIVFRLLEQSGPLQDPFNANALLMAYSTGTQSLGRRLQAIILLEFPELYVSMVKERASGNSNSSSSGDTSPKSN
jgi:hypothetical protein